MSQTWKLRFTSNNISRSGTGLITLLLNFHYWSDTLRAAVKASSYSKAEYTLLYSVGNANWFNLYIPSWLDTQEFSGNTVNCLSPMNLSRRFLKVFKVGAVTTYSGNPFHGEIILTEKKFLRISFLHYFSFNFRVWPRVEFSLKQKQPNWVQPELHASRMVNVGTSSKMCQRNFVPTPHPGTLEIVPTLRNE